MKHRPTSRAEARRLRDDAALRRAARAMSGRTPGKHRPVSTAPDDLAVSHLDRRDGVGRTEARRIVAGATAAVAIAAGAAWTGANIAQGASEAYRTHAVDADAVIVSGCVIRFSNPDGTPSIHANAAHQCAGVESVGIDPDSGWVEVKQSVRGATENVVLFAQCQTDETLGGRRGIVCGASGGTGSTRFALFDTVQDRPLDLRDAADRDRVQHKNANLWVGFFHRPGGWSK